MAHRDPREASGASVDPKDLGAKPSVDARAWPATGRGRPGTTIAMSISPRDHAQRASWGHRFASVLIEIRTDEGLVGISTAVGGNATVAIIHGISPHDG